VSLPFSRVFFFFEYEPTDTHTSTAIEAQVL